MCASKAKQGIHSAFPTGRKMFSYLHGKHGSIKHKGDLRRQMPSLWTSSPFLLLTQLYMQNMTPHSVGHPCGRLGPAVLALSPHSSLCTPSPLGGGVGWEAEKDLSLCKCFSAVMKTPLCYQYSLGHKPKTQSPTRYYEENDHCLNWKQHLLFCSD